LGALQKESTVNKPTTMRVKSKEERTKNSWLQTAEAKAPENGFLYG